MDLKVAEALAKQLMAEHLRSGVWTWTFGFDNARQRFGLCSFTRRHISLSRVLVALNDESQVRDTILHEIAHANVGGSHHHDDVWRQEALRLGCNGKRCYDPENMVMPVPAWVSTCSRCQHLHFRPRKPRLYVRVSCGQCSPRRFNPEFVLVWRRNTEGLRPAPHRRPADEEKKEVRPDAVAA